MPVEAVMVPSKEGLIYSFALFRVPRSHKFSQGLRADDTQGISTINKSGHSINDALKL